MFSIHGWEWVIILAILILLWGPSRIPGLAKSVGNAIGQFRSGVKGVKDDLDLNPEEDSKANKEAGKA